MYIFLIIIWLFTDFVGISILFKVIFNKNIFERILTKNLYEATLLIGKKMIIIESSEVRNLKENPFVQLFFYTTYLLIVTVISQWILPEAPPPIWIIKIIYILGIISVIIIPVILIIYHVKYFIKLFETIPRDIKKLKKEKNIFIGLLMFMKISFIMLSPGIVFTFIYGLCAFLSNIPDYLEDLISLRLFVYSMSVSFPIPVEEITNPKITWWKYISLVQVFIQRIIEIGVLGYIINIISETFNHNDTFKNNNI